MATVCWLLLLVTMMAGMIQAGRETPPPDSLESVDKSGKLPHTAYNR